MNNIGPGVGYVAFLYDTFLTFPEEFDLIWRSKASFAKYAFLFNKYIVLGVLTTEMISGLSANRRSNELIGQPQFWTIRAMSSLYKYVFAIQIKSGASLTTHYSCKPICCSLIRFERGRLSCKSWLIIHALLGVISICVSNGSAVA